MRMHHIAKTVLQQARVGTTASEEAEVIHAGMNMLDACCLTAAVALLGSGAMFLEHYYHLNGDIVFEGGTIIGAHPTHVAIKRGVVTLASLLVGGGDA